MSVGFTRYASLDLQLERCSQEQAVDRKALSLEVDDATSSSTSFLKDALDLAHDSLNDQSSVIIRLIFSKEEGYIIRCDFVQRRFEGCPFAQKVQSFLSPLQHVRAAPDHLSLGEANLHELVSMAVGGILASHTSSEQQSVLLDGLDAETENRLSFPWLCKEPIARKRIVWVQGREDFASIHRAYEGAWALGINLVIIDQAGHWLEDDDGPYAYLREAFIPRSIDVDADFSERIANAVREYPLPVDGLVTISDVRLPSIAKASEMLGLPTSPYESYKLAGDKGVTRLMEEPRPGDFTAVVTSVEELKSLVEKRVEEIRFPLIVKPCLGWNSDCVSKVKNLDELQIAVGRACGRHANAPTKVTRAVIEPYIGGPEVDANFILLDGEVLFFQVSDDFPSTGDTPAAARSPEAAAAPNFMETIMMLPSGLPDNEQAILRDSLKKSIFRQGFSSGVVHCEARVRDSRTRYEPRSDNGLVDLTVPESSSEQEPSCYLHEINFRPPGYFSSVSVMLAHGIDYYAVRMLFALGDAQERIRAMSVPFKSDTQYTLGIAVFPADRTGIMETPDAIVEMMDKYPWMKEWIADYQTMRKGGSKVFGPGESELWYVGYASVLSRSGRGECLERIQKVKDSFSFRLVGE